MDKTMVSVPVEPTEAMLKAAHAAMLSDIPPDGESTYGPTISTHAIYRAYWAAMLSAAPAPQPVQGEAAEHRMMLDDLRLYGAAFSKNGKRIPPEDVYITQPPAPAVGDGMEQFGNMLAIEGTPRLIDAWNKLHTPAVQSEVSPASTSPTIAAPDHIADARKMVAAPGDTWPATEADEAAMAQADDAGNPAWWRGHDEACTILCQKVHAILDGRGSGRGVANEPWESTRRRLLALVAAPGDVEQHIYVRHP